MTKLRHLTIAAAAALCLSLVSASLAQAACPTTNPAADFGQANFGSDAEIQTSFTSARAAEGCNTPLVLPAGYDAMTPQQQNLWLFNNEREVRGETALKLDPTVMSQIALTHSQEEAQYSYFSHASPINQKGKQTFVSGVVRDTVNPAFSKEFFSETLASGFTTPAQAVFGYMYQDSQSTWGHRATILQAAFNWVGIGIVLKAGGEQFSNYYSEDFGVIKANYTPPTKADTAAPLIGPVTYANGTATVTGVSDNPLNANNLGANPITAGVTAVVFYTNNIVTTGPAFSPQEFNTVAGSETAPGSGTWTAQMTVNAGEVLHAVAVDGSGNFTDSAPPAPPTTLKAGENPVAIPPAGGAEEEPEEEPAGAPKTARKASASPRSVPAVTPTAAALVASIDKQFKGKAVKSVRVYVNGRWTTYRPGKSKNFALYTNEGVVITMKRRGSWKPGTRQERYTAPRVRLHRGWNFVAAPYPITGMTCHAVRLELAGKGDRLQEISIGPKPNTGMIMKPEHGKWGNDLTMHISNQDGFWIKDAGSGTWTPSPEGYQRPEHKL
jgi:uncharacterized protein YkwD